MTSSTSPTATVTLDSSGGRALFAQADTLRAAGPAVRVRLPDQRPDVVSRLCGQVFVGIDDQDPVARRGLEPDVAGGGEVAGPGVVTDRGAGAGRDVRRRVGRARVDHDDLVGDARQAGQAAREHALLVLDDQAGRKGGRAHATQYPPTAAAGPPS